MITSITLENFKSYKKAELPLEPLSFLIGANASGKSNALEAIRLLSWLAKGSRIDDIERSIQGADSLVRGKSADLFRDKNTPFKIGCLIADLNDNKFEFTIEISLLSDQLIISGESVYKVTKSGDRSLIYSIDGQPNQHTDEISVMYNNFAKGKNKPHIPCSNRQAIFYQLETPGRFDKKHLKSQKEIPLVTKVIREALRSMTFLDPRPTEMRDYSYIRDDEIKEDGSNLSSVLHKICHSGEGSKSKVLSFIRSLPEQDILDINFIITDRNDTMLRLVESFGDAERNADAPLLSDGTLRVLAVGATLLSSPSGSLVIIEEIDNGVHPSRAENLIQQIQKISKERSLRVLLTSHNPALLDAVPGDALDDVLCCYREPKEGDSKIAKLGALERYPELVAQGPLGQLMARRTLENVLKDTSTSEERSQKALSWLHEFISSTVDES